MENNKNTVEEALLQIRNLEEALQENVKGVLRSTMKEEIKELVKESLNEQAEVEDEEEGANIEDVGAEDEVEVDDTEFDMGDEEEMDSEEGDMEFDMGDEEEFDAEDETVDLTGASDEEVLKVFKAMGDEDGIIVKKENDMVHLEDGEDEYLIQLEESYMEEGDYHMEEGGHLYIDEEDDLTSKDFEFNEGDSMGSTETLYEVEFEDEDEDEDEDFEELSFGDEDEDEDEDFSGFSFDDEDEDEDEDFSGFSFDDEDEDEEEEYSDDEDEDEEEYFDGEDEDYEEMEEDSMGNLENQIMEALKSKMKPKGVGMGNPSKFKYNQKPNMSGGFNEKRKEGPKSVGTGKAKFEYKEGENMGKKPNKKVVAKKEETKEAVRINSYARANKVGNRKGFNQNVNREEIRQRPNTRRVNEEVEMLRERNEEYKKALDVFRTKLNEVAVFNSNLAYATRLFTEHSTTKQEKINILRRFDEVDSLKESKNLYRSIKGELTNTTSNEKTITESIEKTVKTPASGSAANLIESKTYENPQFLRMKDLMSKIN
jgi:hypothetical protein